MAAGRSVKKADRALAGADGSRSGRESSEGEAGDGTEAYREDTEGRLHPGAVHESTDGRPRHYEGEPEHEQALLRSGGAAHPRARQGNAGEPDVRARPQRAEPRRGNSARLHGGLDQPDDDESGETEGVAPRHGRPQPAMMPEREADNVPGARRVRTAARARRWTRQARAPS